MDYSSTLKTEAVCSPETKVNFYQTKRRRILKYGILHSHRCDNLKSNAVPLNAGNFY
jgi:hypothetical protein